MKFFACAVLSLLALSAHADSVTISWTLPTTYTDGSALAASAITGFEVDCYDSTTATDCAYPAYGNKTAAGAVTSMLYDVGTVPAAGLKLCWRVRTLVAAPNTPSDYTPSVCKTWAAAPKKASAPTAPAAK